VKILLAHNFYQQPGGEDRVFAAEGALLEERGHEVYRYTLHNDRVTDLTKVGLAKASVWNGAHYAALRGVFRRERPHVAHFHNTFPLISPAACHAARAEGVPVVQTLHNYRLLCPNALFFRSGRVCEDCLHKPIAWPGVVHACYRNSRAASATVATMLGVHRALGTWSRAVDLHIVPSEFARRKFIEGGLPPERLVVKPHFVHPDPGPGAGRGGYALFVGRLSPEKGVHTLLRAWGLLPSTAAAGAALKIVGDGPLAVELSQVAARLPGVSMLGPRSEAQVYELLGEASCLVVPSESYETFGRVIVEAFARGTPVVASDIGAIAEAVEHGRTGLLCAPGDPESLAAQLERLMTDDAERGRMRGAARAEFEAKYTAERNYALLADIYRQVIGTRGRAAAVVGG
jgi:glycosyltransferase involved in cell wall biosynthesis